MHTYGTHIYTPLDETAQEYGWQDLLQWPDHLVRSPWVPQRQTKMQLHHKIALENGTNIIR